MRQTLPALAASILLLLGFSILTSRSIATSSTIVISEFRTRGPNGGNDEFIELYNLSSSPVNISGWFVKGSNSSGTTSTRANINGGTILNPGCHYLLTNSSPSGGPYSGSVPGNQTYGVGITDDGGIALVDSSGTIIDQVGLSSGSAYKEGSTLSPQTSNSNTSYERRPGGASGNSTDTDNNIADFRSISSDPQNASSGCIGTGTSTDPSGSGMASPSSLTVGGTTLLSVRVTPGNNPSSTGITVTGNLSSIGQSSSQQFFDDGTHGDAVPNDRIFSFLVTVAANATAGQKLLSIRIADSQSRIASASITLTVQPSDIGRCGVERWGVKTGTDSDANLVNLLLQTPTTISEMRSWARPASLPENSRIAPYETTVWVVAGILTQYKLEDDSDYHLILRDESGDTIITEIPCPCCVGTGSPFASMIANARMQFDSRLRATESFQTANIPVQIMGVGFFDFPHNQIGAAPNQIELHPVLSISFDVTLHVPTISGATIDGKKLLVSGMNFDDGAKIYVDGEKQKTKNDGDNPTTVLIAKKAGKNISRGQMVTLVVRNSDGASSASFSFTRPE